MKLKVEKKTISIRDYNDNNREVLRDILINDENKEKSDSGHADLEKMDFCSKFRFGNLRRYEQF